MLTNANEWKKNPKVKLPPFMGTLRDNHFSLFALFKKCQT